MQIINARELKEKVSLVDLLEEMSLRGLLEEVAGRYSQHVSELQLDDQMKNDLIYSDRFMLDSIITNLVENAFKYGGEGVYYGDVDHPVSGQIDPGVS
jgi:signal transduction histidine kinase